jgi:hypothetical protein
VCTPLSLIKESGCLFWSTSTQLDQLFHLSMFSKGSVFVKITLRGATMSMQPWAWMTSYLFSAWISHFIECVQRMGGISTENMHLLILNGHYSHVTLDVVQEARAAGLDLLTLPSHTSHALQPLDVSVFKPFKTFFREYRNF